MKRCILFMPKSHRLFDDVKIILGSVSEIIQIFDKTNFSDEESVVKLNPDFICSFLNPIIFKNAILEVDNINFHPAPPQYPGRGGASYALFNQEGAYGATAHRMTPNIDAGEIFYTTQFDIQTFDSCESVYAKAELACIDLLRDFANHLFKHGAFPKSCEIKWGRQAYTGKEFNEWLVLDPSDTENFERKIRATKHSKFPGPYVMVNGHRFSLADK